MIENHEKIWWHGEDVIASGEHFVGYKGSTRLAEMSHEYPKMIEIQPSIKGNRQYMYRFQFENTAEFLPTLPDKLKQFVKGLLFKNNREVKKYIHTPVYNDNHSAIIGFKKEKIDINQI